jgi:hypothetical protein
MISVPHALKKKTNEEIYALNNILTKLGRRDNLNRAILRLIVDQIIFLTTLTN